MKHTIYELKPDCRHFKGYKPCMFAKLEEGLDCWNCKKHYSPFQERILLIKLGEIGDVIRTTPISRAIKEKYPKSFLIWLVEKKAADFLEGNPFIDEIRVFDNAHLLRYLGESFDIIICLDKDIASATITKLAKSKQKVGWTFTSKGLIWPLTKPADEKYLLGVSDTLNRKSKKSYMENIYDITGLEPSVQDYILNIPESSIKFGKDFMHVHGITSKDIVIGFNHGCGYKFKTRKWPLSHYAELAVKLIKKDKRIKIILLGGPYERESNVVLDNTIKAKLNSEEQKQLLNPGTETSIMDFCGLINACDIILTGVTMALHVAIGLKKKVIVFMGPIVKSEIDTFGLGPLLTSKTHKCLGCFKDECSMHPSCMEAIKVNRVYREILKRIK